MRNKKVILINSKGYIHDHNSIYKKAEVVFSSLEIGLNKILEGGKNWRLPNIINELAGKDLKIDLSIIDGKTQGN